MTSILPEIFAPPRIATNGRFGIAASAAEVVELGLHQESSHGRLQMLRRRPPLMRARDAPRRRRR